MIAFSLMVLFIVKISFRPYNGCFFIIKSKGKNRFSFDKINEKKIGIPYAVLDSTDKISGFFVIQSEYFTFVADSTQGVAYLESFL